MPAQSTPDVKLQSPTYVHVTFQFLGRLILHYSAWGLEKNILAFKRRRLLSSSSSASVRHVAQFPAGHGAPRGGKRDAALRSLTDNRTNSTTEKTFCQKVPKVADVWMVESL